MHDDAYYTRDADYGAEYYEGRQGLDSWIPGLPDWTDDPNDTVDPWGAEDAIDPDIVVLREKCDEELDAQAKQHQAYRNSTVKWYVGIGVAGVVVGALGAALVMR